MPKIGVVQMTSSSNLEANLKKMREFLAQAVAKSAEVVVFPEIAYFTTPPDLNAAVANRFDELIGLFSAWAKESGVYLLPGTLRQPSKEGPQAYNTLPLIDPRGNLVAKYNKIFLFKAALSDRSYDETVFFRAGNEVVTADCAFGKVGLSICFDLRFSELFRALKKRGAQVVFLPAAFTVPTGKAHWKTLLTARAIENGVFVVASGQTGVSGDGAEKYGHSIVISPWGEIVCEFGTDEEVRVVDLDFDQISAAKKRVDTWASRREDLFPIG